MKSVFKKTRVSVITELLPRLAFLFLVFISPVDHRENMEGKLLDSATNQVLRTYSSNDSSGANSIDTLKEVLKREKERYKATGSNVDLKFIGVKELEECKDCMVTGNRDSVKQHFISLNGFALKENSEFRIIGNEYFIERNISGPGKVEQEKINVRLSEAGAGQKGLRILIPVSYSSYRWFRIIIIVLTIIAAILAVWFCIILPVEVLLNITKGKAFVQENAKSLKRSGWAIVIACLALVFLPAIARILLSGTIPADIYFPTWPTLFDYRWPIFIGVALILLSRAFRQGMNLQEDRDLTI